MQKGNVDFFPWNSDFCTGFIKIDEQNEKLLLLLNKMANDITFGNTDIQLLSFIEDFIGISAYRLDSKANYWLSTSLKPSEIKNYQQQNLQFIEKIKDFKSEIEIACERADYEKLLSFLIRWIASHILESDKRISFYILAFKEGKSDSEAKSYSDKQMKVSAHNITSELLSNNHLRLMKEIKLRNGTLNELYLSEQRLKEAMSYAKIGYWTLPINSNKAYWSPEMYELFGLSKDSVSSPETLCSIMNKDYHAPFICSVTSAFDTGGEHHVEYPIVRPSDGAERWIECKGRISYREDGTPDNLTGFVQDITAHKETESKIEQLAYYDSLTHLPNRRLLLERLNQKLASSNRNKHSNALLYLDIDNFKTLNDIHGHDYGDLLLSQTATRISKSIRLGDTAARVGGDEFVIILEQLSKDSLQAATDAEAIGHKILESLALPFQINEIEYSNTCSLGIVLFNGNSLSSSELMKQADIAMYQAKQAGKNTQRFFDLDMQKDIAERVSIEDKLRKAITEKEFELFYQPQFNQHNEILSAEALIRWNHPELGLTSPQYFIPLAEDTGLIVPIGHWVIENACSQLKSWSEHPSTRHLSLSVNVSSKQFQQSNFVSQVGKIIDKYAIDTGKLKLELTESILAENLDLTIIKMNELGKMGVQLSLDDFGTGYSSLQYLKKLPLFQLKIDYSFVRDIMTDSSDRSIVKTIISMAKGLGLSVIAEGVEEEEQKQYLLSKECMLYQGFLFSKPVPIDKFDELIK